MKAIAVALCTVLCAGAGTAMGTGFEACKEGVFPDYYVGVEAAISRHSKGESQVAFTSRPSFEPEWGVRVAASGIVSYVKFSESFWYRSMGTVRYSGAQSFDPSSVNARTLYAEISAELVESIVAAARSALSNLADEQEGFDGTTYRLSVDGVCGETWSPEADSEAARIVAVFEELAHVPSSGSSVVEYETRIRSRLMAAIAK